MQITIDGKLYDYDTIAQFVERKMNGANVHDLKVNLAVIRFIFMRTSKGYTKLDQATKDRFLAVLSELGYK